ELAGRGRGRLLHPKPELAAMGHPFDPAMHPADTTTVPDQTPPLLSVEDLHVHFPIRSGVFSRVSGYVKAVNGVSFNVYRGQTLGLVGESGCGKTTTGRAILRLVPITSGRVRFDDKPLSELEGSELRSLRRKLQIIFQDPYSSLNPRMTVEAMLVEPMTVHGLYGSRNERRDRAAALLR